MKTDGKVLKNISKWGSAIYKNNYVLRSSGVYFRDARLVQYSQINQCNLPYLQAKEGKNHTIISINS